jgi:hypothetical protein
MLVLVLASERFGEDWAVPVVSVSDETHECERDSAVEEKAMPEADDEEERDGAYEADAAELPSCPKVKLELDPLRLRLRVPTTTMAALFLSMRIPDDTALPLSFPLLVRVRVGVSLSLSLSLSLLWMYTLGEGVCGEWMRHASRGSHRNGGLGGELRLRRVQPSSPQPAICTEDDDDDEDERDASIATLMSVFSSSFSSSLRSSACMAASADPQVWDAQSVLHARAPLSSIDTPSMCYVLCAMCSEPDPAGLGFLLLSALWGQASH